MKGLVDFLNEKLFESKDESKKTFSFNFNDLPNAKETIESLVDMAEDKDLEYESSENDFSITLSKDLCQNDRSKIDGIQDVLQQFTEIIRSDSKNASSESFAQKTHSFMDKVNEMVKFIDDAEAENDEEDDKKEDDKEKKEEE